MPRFTFRIPIISAVVEMPEMLDPTGPANSRVNRVHNRAVKDAMRKTLNYHHREHMPKHFEPSARLRYAHKPRSIHYQRNKIRRFGKSVDLVKRGKLRRNVLRGRKTVQIGGSAASGEVRGKMTYRLPMGMAEGPKEGRVTIDDMKRELTETTETEDQVLARLFAQFYVAEVDKNLTSRRVRKRIAPRLRQLGIKP